MWGSEGYDEAVGGEDGIGEDLACFVEEEVVVLWCAVL